MDVRIAVDAMGGDNGPATAVKAGISAAERAGVHILLVGDIDEVSAHVPGEMAAKVRMVHAERGVGMEEKISLKLLKERTNSMRTALNLVKNGEADCALSAGNTSAFVTLAVRELGVMEGAGRPGIAVLLPTGSGGLTIFVDAGANVNAKPAHLLAYGIMGQLYAREVFDIPKPTVGLLNIGEESVKGDDLRKEAFRMMKECERLNFVGNVEGQELMAGRVNVVVTDGFTGNAILKVSEGIMRTVKNTLRREFTGCVSGRIGAMFLRPSLKRFARRVDYADYGGGVLLGVNGTVIISHGRSSRRALVNAIDLGRKMCRGDFLTRLKAELGKI